MNNTNPSVSLKVSKKQLLNNSIFKCIFMLKVQVKILQNNRKQGSLLLPPNPKWSQLKAFSVAILVSTLFTVPVCSRPVHWDHWESYVSFHSKFYTQLDELTPASQNCKKWLKICKNQTVIEKCIYVFLVSMGI